MIDNDDNIKYLNNDEISKISKKQLVIYAE